MTTPFCESLTHSHILAKAFNFLLSESVGLREFPSVSWALPRFPSLVLKGGGGEPEWQPYTDGPELRALLQPQDENQISNETWQLLSLAVLSKKRIIQVSFNGLKTNLRLAISCPLSYPTSLGQLGVILHPVSSNIFILLIKRNYLISRALFLFFSLLRCRGFKQAWMRKMYSESYPSLHVERCVCPCLLHPVSTLRPKGKPLW